MAASKTNKNKNNKKNTNTKNNTKSNAKTSSKKTDSRSKGSAKEQKVIDERREMLKAEVLSIVLLGVSVIVFICVVASERMGIAGGYISAGLKHLFGIGAVILPVVLIIFSLQTLFDKTKYGYKFKLSLFIGFFLTIISLAYVFSNTVRMGDVPFPEFVSDTFFGGSVHNGGFIGALTGGALYALLGKTGAAILLVIAGIILIVLATGRTIAEFVSAVGDWIDDTKEDFAEYRSSHTIIDEEDEDYYEEDYEEKPRRFRQKPQIAETEQQSRPLRTAGSTSAAPQRKSAGKSSVFIDLDDEPRKKEERVIIEEGIFGNEDGSYGSYADEYGPDYEPVINIPGFVKKTDSVDAEADPGNNNEDQGRTEGNTPKIINTYSENPPEQEDSEEEYTDSDEPEIIEAEKTQTVRKLDSNSASGYKFPSPSLLAKNPNKAGTADKEELIRKSRLLEETLATFGVNAKVVNVSQGPTVTRYELIPPKGTLISKITRLDKEMELALKAKSIRIEAPIPGTNRIGIELGNDNVSLVYFSEILLTDKFRDFKSKLAFGVGKDITGTVIVADIIDMTHLLIAGATGTGKSVCINTLITSILYKATPDEVKLIMIDPKKVELSVYNGIPHLLIPVVTDVQKAAGALSWAIREMERRYDLLEKEGVRNIKGYNAIEGIEKLPYIVIIVDELADLMMTTGKEVENAVVRLAQLARAAGMHLVIATQRPDANIVTGLIKSNIPSRIAFQVAGSVNSKIILDSTGAEKLLGKGDMLLKTRAFDDKPLRVQGAFVTDDEVEAIVNSIKTDEPHYDESVIAEIERSVAEAHGEESDSSVSGDSDDLVDEVIRLVAYQQKASTSFIQRKFKIGYNRAARIIDELEERGIVGPDLGGTKGREVLIDKYQYNEWKNRKDTLED